MNFKADSEMTSNGDVFAAQVSKMQTDELRTLVQERIANAQEDEHVIDGDFINNPEAKDWVIGQAVVPAAVLIPIIKRETGLSILLTMRTKALSSHSAQIAFPGGKIDQSDISIEAAALRETEEEIGISHQHVEIMATMPDYLTGSGFRISPVIGLVDPDADIQANPDEVEYVFEVPFGFLMDKSNHQLGSREFMGKQRFYLEMPYGEHYIWGVTAGIIRVLRDRLAGERF